MVRLLAHLASLHFNLIWCVIIMFYHILRTGSYYLFICASCLRLTRERIKNHLYILQLNIKKIGFNKLSVPQTLICPFKFHTTWFSNYIRLFGSEPTLIDVEKFEMTFVVIDSIWPGMARDNPNKTVVFFDKQRGAPLAICWSKSFVSAWKQVFSSFSITNRKKRKESAKKHRKTCTKWVRPAN